MASTFFSRLIRATWKKHFTLLYQNRESFTFGCTNIQELSFLDWGFFLGTGWVHIQLESNVSTPITFERCFRALSNLALGNGGVIQAAELRGVGG